MKAYIKDQSTSLTKENLFVIGVKENGKTVFYPAKEIDLSELMIEFAKWLMEKEINFDKSSGFYYEAGHYDDPPINVAKLFDKFTIEKGYIN